jgi:hypothetical protein
LVASEAKTETVLLSLNGLVVSLKKRNGAFHWGEIRWSDESHIAFDTEKNEATVCVDGVKSLAQTVSNNPVAFAYYGGNYAIRWRIYNSDGACVLTLLFEEVEEPVAMLVVTVTGEHAGFEMTNSLLRCLNNLSTPNKNTQRG